MAPPSALSSFERVASQLRRGRTAVFIDYDGTLTPIVPDPVNAKLPARTRSLLRRLAERCPVAVLSGRELDDVRTMVGLDELVYAGSHGFEVSDERFGLPGGIDRDQLLRALDLARDEVEPAVAGIRGVWVEPKRFAVAVHFRNAPDRLVPDLERLVSRVASRHLELRMSRGKKIFELRPDVPWDKGKALNRLVDGLESDQEPVVPVYIGDDTTDEDAFREVADGGIGIRVGDPCSTTAARYRLRDPDEVALFLERLLALELGESSPVG